MATALPRLLPRDLLRVLRHLAHVEAMALYRRRALALEAEAIDLILAGRPAQAVAAELRQRVEEQQQAA